MAAVISDTTPAGITLTISKGDGVTYQASADGQSVSVTLGSEAARQLGEDLRETA
jgi:hypothetical protein